MSVNIAYQRYAISPKLQNIIGGEREIAGVVASDMLLTIKNGWAFLLTR